ncbi:MAG: hypothetical protein ACERKZ_01420 [Lachnotalea sp.]
MKLKYYLRALGIGIVVTTLILTISSTSKSEKLTDLQIIQKAQELGMVSTDDYNLVNEELDNAKTSIDDLQNQLDSVDNATQQDDQDNSTDISATDQNQVPETDQNQVAETDATTKNEEASSDDATTEEINTDDSVDKNTMLQFEITAGMGTGDVAELLEQKGIIDSASDFSSYIVNSGNTNNMQIGQYEVTNGDSYDTILSKIIGR